MRWLRVTAVVVTAAAVGACDAQQEQERPVTQSEETAQAAQQYDPAAYDTVQWASDSAAIARGADIFKWVCAECHGEEGLGDAGRVIDGDTIRPPSFQRENWPYADDPDALHRKVFIGNTLGMPHWGLRQMRPRDIVAVEKYIRLELIQGDGEG
ncbi:MAG: c-type cytochrome [Candidatus Longimicrobiales bacterium M2_2A_002]